MEEFEKIIEESVDKLPKQFKDILDEKQIAVIAREKTPELLQQQHRGQIVFGVFIGVPYGHFTNVQSEPTRIELYKNSFEQVLSDAVEIKQQISKTVIHEIAHYFGFSEPEIRKRGY